MPEQNDLEKLLIINITIEEKVTKKIVKPLSIIKFN
jgi:hypothetical protein